MKKILIWVSDESLKKVSMVVNEVNSDICILSVKTQKEANSVIINNDVDLFIIEINSNNDSFEFAKDVRKQRAYRFIPVVIMADNEKLIFQAYEIVRCYAFMKKPYDMEGLKEILKKLNNYKFLFMGDSGIDKEKDILDKYNISDIDVLKVGHHGSKTSSDKKFIDEIKPKYSLISVGKNNRYGHPKEEVLNNLEQSKIYRTDLNGSIEIKLNKNGYKIRTCNS